MFFFEFGRHGEIGVREEPADVAKNAVPFFSDAVNADDRSLILTHLPLDRCLLKEQGIGRGIQWKRRFALPWFEARFLNGILGV